MSEIKFQQVLVVVGIITIFAVLLKWGKILERWESGLIQQFAKLSYSIRVPGVRIPLSPRGGCESGCASEV